MQGPIGIRAEYVDAWRGYSAVVVLVPHAIQVFLAPIFGGDGTLTSVTGTLARYAVIVFFIISGYFITSSILGNIRKNGAFRMDDYLIARVARIYPPLLCAIALAVIFWALIQAFALPGAEQYLRLPGAGEYLVRESYSLTASEFLSTLFLAEAVSGIRMMSVNGPLWSLSIEFWLYIIAGLVAVVARGRRRAAALGALALLAWMFLTHFTVRNLFFSSFWIAGAALAIAERSDAVRARRWLRHAAMLGLSCLAAAAAAVAAGWASPGIFDATRNEAASVAVQLLTVPVFMAGVFLLEPSRSFSASRAGASIAGYSYSLYILHLPILLFLFSLAQAMVVASGLTYSVTLGSAAAALGIRGCMVAARVLASDLENSQNYQKRIRKLATLMTMKPGAQG